MKEKYIREDGKEVDVRVFKNSWVLKLFPEDIAGFVLGHNIFLEGNELSPRLMAHELTHIVQIEEDGFFGFYSRYLFDYVKNLFKGMGFNKSYFNIPHEVEAYGNRLLWTKKQDTKSG